MVFFYCTVQYLCVCLYFCLCLYFYVKKLTICLITDNVLIINKFRNQTKRTMPSTRVSKYRQFVQDLSTMCECKENGISQYQMKVAYDNLKQNSCSTTTVKNTYDSLWKSYVQKDK